MTESYSINRNAWHVKMMKYIWNFDPWDFSHICPYFWLSVFNIFAIIFVFPVKSVANLFRWLINEIDDYCDKINERDFMKKVSEAQLHQDKFEELLNLCDKRFNKFYDKLGWMSYKTPELREFREKLYLEREKFLGEKLFREYEENLKKAAPSNKQEINNILKIVKPIAVGMLWIIGAIIGIFVGWLLYKFIIILILVPKHVWMVMGTVLLILAIGMLIGMLIFFGIKWIFSKIPCTINGQEKAKKFFGTIGIIIISPLIAIVIGVMFVGDLIKNNCPAIDWKN